MLIRLLFIVVVAIGFATGFAEIAERSDRTIRPTPASTPCQDWSEPDCGADFQP